MLAPVLRRRVLQPAMLRQRVVQHAMLPGLARFYASFPPHTVVKMPALSPTMTAGNIGAWQKKPGDTISPGDVLVEIETDKAQMDFEYQEDGVLAKILKQTGEKDIPVGNPIAVLVEDSADVAAFESFTLADAGGEAPAPAPAAEPKETPAPPAPTPSAPSTESAPAPAPAEEDLPTTPSGRLQTALDREPNIGAPAKRLAIELGVKVASLKGTGPGGKITVEDVKKAAASAPAGGAGASAATAGAAAGAAYEDLPISGMRKTIASRLTESWTGNPHFFVSASLSVSKLLKLRQALNSTADGRYKLSVNDFLIKAIGVASRKVPQANSSWRDGAIRQFSTVDVSVAVATPSGLITPIVPAVESKGLEAISATVKELAKRARDGKLKPEEYQGGSIAISNMGMNPAVERFTAIINPPQAAILAVGTTKKVAVPAENEDGSAGVEWDDQIVVTASFDHRVVDGAVGAEWIRELKQVVENPLELLL